MVADEADRIDRLARAASGDDDGAPSEVTSFASETGADGGDDLARLDEATGAGATGGEPALGGSDELGAAGLE